MESFQRGIKEAMVGVIGGIVIAAIMKSLSADGLLPSYFVWLFIIVGIAGNIATINSFRWTGTVYTIGWLIGGLLLRDILEPVDYIIYIVAPILILLFRVYIFIQSLRKGY